MSYFEKMFRGSFRNIQFLVPNESEEGGNKIVEHEYPGANIRYVENLGQLPPKFSMDVIIHGDDVDEQRRLLIGAMVRPGIGTLVHPIYGSIEVQAGTYSISTSETEVGVARCTLNFSTSSDAVSLQPEGAGKSEVSAAAQTARAASDDALEERYEEPTFIDSIKAAGEKLDDIYSDVFGAVSDVVNPIQEGISTITRVVNSARRKVFSIVRKVDSLKSSLRALYDSALTVANTPGDLYRAWLDLIDFGFLDLPGKTNTVKRQQSESNRITLNDHTRVNALINAYEAAAYIDFQTDEEIATVRSELEDGYTSLISDGEEGSVVFDVEVRAAINDLRNKVRDALDTAETNVWSVVTTKPVSTSASLLTYQFYGDLANLEVIQNLNPQENHAHINDGQVKVVA